MMRQVILVKSQQETTCIVGYNILVMKFMSTLLVLTKNSFDNFPVKVDIIFYGFINKYNDISFSKVSVKEYNAPFL